MRVSRGTSLLPVELWLYSVWLYRFFQGLGGLVLMGKFWWFGRATAVIP